MTGSQPLAVVLVVVLAVVSVTAAGRALVAARAHRRVKARLAVAGSGRRARRLWSAVAARWRATSAPARDADALTEVVDALARSLRAGTPPREALRSAAGTAPPGLAAGLVAVADAADRGMPLSQALDSWSSTCGVAGADLVATAVAVTGSSGGDAARSLTAVADTLRDRRALRREVRALSSQARLSALVIAVAPAAFAIVAAGTDRTTAGFLLGTPLGLACLALGGGLDLAGWWWMDRITRSVR